ncbi:23S rRNA (pseudouridine(1915)-N(3))-methyltransferase RlmH [Gammaproteobacteria bacterium]|nr:23S rRNA (pseudouridine(1915)-N(3))-methyltransferase RlmH [Gammaproteobacteria bacterium]
MKICLLCIGNKMPDWVVAGTNEYRRRLQADVKLSLVEIPLAKRAKGVTINTCLAQEGASMMTSLSREDYVVSMEVHGKRFDTPALAARIDYLKSDGRSIKFLIGGPDGLAVDCQSRANESWSLSNLTLPHPIARILLLEQLYRGFSILKGHPYHRV